ncbi:MAG: ATP-binding protein [Planctomycetota bacterium]|nr:MAG: ATP-binding protein [Planctomycetota bacterium]
MGRTPPPFLGRTEELKALESRCARPGLTIVKGPPKIGKTTLLKEFVKRSRAGGHRQIGMGEAAEAGGDVLLRAIKDAYSHWLSEDGARAELQSIHAQMKGKYISEVGTAVGVALAECTGPAKGLVGAVFKGLESAKRKVDTGGLTVPRLTSEEARDLLAILAAGQDRPVVAVLNQWEEGQDLDKDTATLRTFLAGLDDWPDFHVVVHLRDPRLPRDRNKEAEGFAATLLEHPAVRALSVGLIEFGMDEVAYPKLMQWLAAHFPAFNAIEHIDTLSDSALEMIGGNPAVLDEWSYLDDDHRVDLERLGEVADDARSLQYPELWTIYRTLLTEARADSAHVPALEVALLAAALPLPPDAEEQAVILPAVLGLATEGDLARLESEDLLRPEGGLRLNLGHSSRREAAERGILGQSERFCKLDGGLARDLKPYLRRAVDRVVPAAHRTAPGGGLESA